MRKYHNVKNRPIQYLHYTYMLNSHCIQFSGQQHRFLNHEWQFLLTHGIPGWQRQFEFICDWSNSIIRFLSAAFQFNNSIDQNHLRQFLLWKGFFSNLLNEKPKRGLSCVNHFNNAEIICFFEDKRRIISKGEKTTVCTKKLSDY